MYTGKKVRLRAYRKEDIPQALEYINDPEVRKYLAVNIPFPIKLEEEMKWYESLSSSGDEYNFAIETLEGSRYIGGCGIHKVDWKNSCTTVGIMIGDKSEWDKGYGTDAMKVMLKFIFEEMNLNKVKLMVYDFNQRGIKSYVKCGFKQEGAMRQELFREGKYHDVIVMGILRTEWEK